MWEASVLSTVEQWTYMGSGLEIKSSGAWGIRCAQYMLDLAHIFKIGSLADASGLWEEYKGLVLAPWEGGCPGPGRHSDSLGISQKQQQPEPESSKWSIQGGFSLAIVTEFRLDHKQQNQWGRKQDSNLHVVVAMFTESLLNLSYGPYVLEIKEWRE